jgi:hypothetical protein
MDEKEFLEQMLASLPKGKLDREYESDMRALVPNGIDDASWEKVPKQGLRFHRVGAVPFVDFAAVADALAMSPEEFARQWKDAPRYEGYGPSTMLEYDELWDFLVWLAEERHPIAARVWLYLYPTFEGWE